MSVYNIFFLLGGLGLFLYGMKLMSDGLQLVAGFKLKKWLEKLTSNKWMGAVLGLVITAIVQSSTATIVMVISFVNTSLMTLQGAVGVIIGANLGTTLTNLIFTFNIQNIAPLVIFLGTLLMLFIKRKEFNNTGMILTGFGILFLGLNLMSTSMIPLKDAAFMNDLFYLTRSPLFGLLVGLIVTAVIQSSTATMGIMFSMVLAGIITDLDQAIFIIYGLNIGTCSTALIATIGASKPAKQTAMVHVVYNVVGVSIFLCFGLLGFNLASIVKSITDAVSFQLIYAHIIFNVIITIILLPLSGYIVKIAQLLVKGGTEDERTFKYIDRRVMSSPLIAVEQTIREISRMMELVLVNYSDCIKLIDTKDQLIERDINKLLEKEEIINHLNKEINKYIVSLNTLKLKDSQIETLNAAFKTIGYLEQIGDLAKDIAHAENLYLKDSTKVSQKTKQQIRQASDLAEKSLRIAFNLFQADTFDNSKLDEIRALRGKILKIIDDKENLKAGIYFVRITNNLNRTVEYALDIAKALNYKNK